MTVPLSECGLGLLEKRSDIFRAPPIVPPFRLPQASSRPHTDPTNATAATSERPRRLVGFRGRNPENALLVKHAVLAQREGRDFDVEAFAAFGGDELVAATHGAESRVEGAARRVFQALA